MMVNKVTVIGFDGLDPRRVKQWLQFLPAFKQLIVNGSFGYMDTVFPPLTMGAWTSMVTGANPGKTGVLGFFTRSNCGSSFVPVIFASGDEPPYEPIWILLNRAGLTCGVVSIPTVFRLDDINGFAISSRFASFSAYPQRLQKEILKLGCSWIFEPFLHDELKSIKNFKLRRFKSQMKKARVVKDLCIRYDVDFKMVVFDIPDTIHHYADHEGEIFELYKNVDKVLGEFSKGSDILVVVSDHGFSERPIRSIFCMGEWLRREGYVVIKSSKLRNFLLKSGITLERLASMAHSIGLKKYKHFPNLKKILPKEKPSLASQSIDWCNSTIYSSDLTGYFYNYNFRMDSEDNGGILQSDIPKVRSELKRKIGALRHMDHPVKIEIFGKEELYHGNNLDSIPDLMLHSSELRITDLLSRQGLFSPVRSAEHWTYSHDHKGTFIISGKNIQCSKEIKSMTIYDIVPTLLYLLDLPIPSDLDGRILKEAILSSYTENYQPKYYTPERMSKSVVNLHNKKTDVELVRRLRALGYIE